jgi:hypothetical protein
VHRNFPPPPKKLAPGALIYRKPHVNQLAFEDFVLPFGCHLCRDNRWGILAKQIPWAVVETAYAQQFPKEDMGSPAMSSRLALAALIFQQSFSALDMSRCDYSIFML